MKVEIDADELFKLRSDNARLEKQVTDLQNRGSFLVEAARNERVERQQQEWVTATLAQAGRERWHCGWAKDVKQFFEVAEQHVPAPFKPMAPAEAVVRFRARLVVEEVLETVKAMFDVGERAVSLGDWHRYRTIKELLNKLVDDAPIRVDMVETIDGVVDSIYVLVGLAISFGTDIVPVWEGVHIANLAKQGGPVRESDGKRLKPPGWEPFNVGRELVLQGWEPSSEEVEDALLAKWIGIEAAAKRAGEALAELNGTLAALAPIPEVDEQADTEPPVVVVKEEPGLHYDGDGAHFGEDGTFLGYDPDEPGR